MCGRLRRESPREARLGIVSAVLRVTFVGAVASGGGAIRCREHHSCRCVVSAHGELTCYSRARMLGANCRLLPRVGCVDEIGVGVRWVEREIA